MCNNIVDSQQFVACIIAINYYLLGKINKKRKKRNKYIHKKYI